MKLHMLSIWYHGKRYTWFASFPVNTKPFVSDADLQRIGISAGTTFCVG